MPCVSRCLSLSACRWLVVFGPSTLPTLNWGVGRWDVRRGAQKPSAPFSCGLPPSTPPHRLHVRLRPARNGSAGSVHRRRASAAPAGGGHSPSEAADKGFASPGDGPPKGFWWWGAWGWACLQKRSSSRVRGLDVNQWLCSSRRVVLYRVSGENWQ